MFFFRQCVHVYFNGSTEQDFTLHPTRSIQEIDAAWPRCMRQRRRRRRRSDQRSTKMRALMRVALASVAAACLVDQTFAEDGLTEATAPESLESLHFGASCYFRSHFIGRKDLVDFDIAVLRDAQDELLDQNLEGFAISFHDIVDQELDLDRVFASNVTAILAETFAGPSNELTYEMYQNAYSGEPYMRYSTSERSKFYQFFKDGKYKYSGDHEHIRSAFIVCVVPPAWVSEATLDRVELVEGIELHVKIEETDFELRVWKSLVYRLVFQYGSMIGALMNIVESAFGLYIYYLFCSLEEIRKAHTLPVLCLTLNLMSTTTIGLVMVLDGWGSTGFLTEETQSVFVTFTMSTTLGTVILIGVHWIRLRRVIASVRKAARYRTALKGSSSSSQNHRSDNVTPNKGLTTQPEARGGSSLLDRWLNHPRAALALKVLAFFCCLVDLVCFVYAKLLRRSVEDIWKPLLLILALLSLFCAAFFMKEASGFARDIANLVHASNFNNPENLSYLQRTTYHMEGASFFLIFTVPCTTLLAFAPIRTKVGLWIWLWEFMFVVRIGVAHNVNCVSYLNRTGRKRRGHKISPSTSPPT